MNSNLLPSALHSPHYSRRSKACSLTRSTLSSPLPITHLTTADEAMRALSLSHDQHSLTLCLHSPQQTKQCVLSCSSLSHHTCKRRLAVGESAKPMSVELH